jgi:hypothetical protein
MATDEPLMAGGLVLSYPRLSAFIRGQYFLHLAR